MTMKKSRFINEQIAFALRPAELGVPAEEVCRKLNKQRGHPHLLIAGQ